MATLTTADTVCVSDNDHRENLERTRQQSCLLCGSPPPVDAAHIMSRGAGGPDEIWNLMPLCRKCHSEQHTVGIFTFTMSHLKVWEHLCALGWEIFNDKLINKFRNKDHTTVEGLQKLDLEGSLPGLYPNIPSEVYHHPECPGVSSTIIRDLRRNPEFAMHRHLRGESSDALDIGSALHDLVLLPEIFNNKYVALPEGMRRDARNKEYQKFSEINKNRTILTVENYDNVRAMADAIRKHPIAISILKDSKNEHSAWSEINGTMCKCRPDILTSDGLCVDLKTSKDATIFGFQRKIYEHGYHIAAAFYLDILRAIGCNADKFIFLVIEKNPPHQIATYALQEAAVELGRSEYTKLLGLYKNCKLTNVWPGYPTRIVEIGLPSWAWNFEGGENGIG